jgi:hypothetical protein
MAMPNSTRYAMLAVRKRSKLTRGPREAAMVFILSDPIQPSEWKHIAIFFVPTQSESEPEKKLVQIKEPEKGGLIPF